MAAGVVTNNPLPRAAASKGLNQPRKKVGDIFANDRNALTVDPSLDPSYNLNNPSSAKRRQITAAQLAS